MIGHSQDNNEGISVPADHEIDEHSWFRPNYNFLKSLTIPRRLISNPRKHYRSNIPYKSDPFRYQERDTSMSGMDKPSVPVRGGMTNLT